MVYVVLRLSSDGTAAIKEFARLEDANAFRDQCERDWATDTTKYVIVNVH